MYTKQGLNCLHPLQQRRWHPFQLLMRFYVQVLSSPKASDGVMFLFSERERPSHARRRPAHRPSSPLSAWRLLPQHLQPSPDLLRVKLLLPHVWVFASCTEYFCTYLLWFHQNVFLKHVELYLCSHCLIYGDPEEIILLSVVMCWRKPSAPLLTVTLVSADSTHWPHGVNKKHLPALWRNHCGTNVNNSLEKSP